jgi:hypothetical protein
MAVTGVSDVGVAIQKVVSALTTKTLIQESVALSIPGVWDRSNEVMEGMDRLDMLELAELAVQSVDEAGGDMTPQTINPSKAELDLDQHKSIPFSVTKRGSLQSKIALVSKTVETAVRTLANEVDDAIFAEMVLATKTTNTVAGADALEDILKLKEQFDLDNVPKAGRALIASPVFMSVVLGTNSVIKANEFGSAEGIRAGLVGSIFGIEIFESSSASIPNDGFVACGMEAVAFARQRAVEFEEEKKVLGQRSDYALTHLYGVQSTKTSLNPRIYVHNPA